MKTLTHYHDALFATIDNAGIITIDTSLVSSGWSQPIPGLLVSEGYVDLAGLSMEEKTIFIEGLAVQQSGLPAIDGTAGDNYTLIDIMSSIPIDTSSALMGLLPLRGLGFPGTALNFEHVLYQRYRRYALDLDYSQRSAVTNLDEQSGSAAPTATDRIYCYRLVYPNLSQFPGVTTYDSLNVPAARYLLNVVPKSEEEYRYIMRLKTSYDLQQSHDED